MSDLKLTVGGRSYTVACTDGQEEHVQRLANVIDGKLGNMGANLSSQEAKNLLFAALLLADELEEAKRSATPQPAPAAAFDAEHIAGRLERLATAIENVAATLDGGLESAAPNA
ncbi:cell division protein ZapA [Qipengyuania marisflavi]|uniref:Cell division protein ZapA n=1 Tax=Qipengyuania marisflavi TaxID=2486356 RepID=A0A5S3P8V6_9SPHN|nr:cell division protein ZapA [Qipengyuania marisflavi]TMM49743.1 cell division protein ZapA [Qipengyuania marisflavi]